MIEALLLVFGVAAGSLVWWFSRHRRRLPPSPGIPLPFLGHLQMLGVSDPREVFASMRKKYGEIFSFYTGSRLVVVLNGYEAIHEALVKNSDVFSARPETFISRHMAHGQGILNTSGEHWQEQRRFTERAMRGIGINDTSAMEAKVLEEVSALMDKLDKTCDHTADQPLNLPELFLASISNVIVSIIYGHRFDLDDPAYCKALRALNNCFKNFGNMQPLNVFPIVRYLPGDPCGFHECVDNMNTLESTLVYPELDKHQQVLHDGQPDDVVSAYMLEMERKRGSGIPTSMDEENLVKVAGDLLAGGSETPSTTMLWFLLYMLHYPHIQERCYQEIVENIGKDQAPSMAKRLALPYTEATILEVQRHADVGPMGMPHGLSRDTELRGYDIPSDAMVVANLHSVHHDPEVWGDPEVFRPERFLDAEGCLVRSKYFIPYSVGSRKCPGEGLARMELFLYATSILQRYHLSCRDSILPPLKGSLALLHKPPSFNVRFQRRQ